MLIAHTRVYEYNSGFATATSAFVPRVTLLRKPDSPANLAHVKVLIARPSSPAGRIAPYALPSIL
jgi:hypothetical protein